MTEASNKIPAQKARELRAMAHDLSNSLETIVQASYLLMQANLPATTKRWVEMIDQASQDAVHINRKLRELLRAEG